MDGLQTCLTEGCNVGLWFYWRGDAGGYLQLGHRRQTGGGTQPALVILFGPSDRRLHLWGFPKIGDASKLDHSAVVLSPLRSPSSACAARCKGED